MRTMQSKAAFIEQQRDAALAEVEELKAIIEELKKPKPKPKPKAKPNG